MNSKIYIGNLSYNTTEYDLRTLFSQAGTVVSVTMIKDRDTGRSKGFAFIEMGAQSEAEQAIKMFNGTSLADRQIRVDLAQPRKEFPPPRSRDRFDQGRRDRRRRGSNRSSRY